MESKFFGAWPAQGVPLNPDIIPPGFQLVTVELLDEITTRLVQGLRPEKIILFGSYAYGAPTVDSDLDLLVIFSTELQGADRFLKVSNLLRPRPVPMDILVRTPAEIQMALTAGDPFLTEILTKGRLLYERTA